MELPKQLDEDGRVPSYLDHGGLNSGEDTRMAAVAGTITAPLPKLKRCSQGVEEVEEDTVEPHANWRWQFRGGE